jgi:hypothetical protein
LVLSLVTLALACAVMATIRRLPGWRSAWQKRQFDDDALFKTRHPPGWIG